MSAGGKQREDAAEDGILSFPLFPSIFILNMMLFVTF